MILKAHKILGFTDKQNKLGSKQNPNMKIIWP